MAEETKKKNKLLMTALILFIGVSLIPLIYSTTYVASVWDVYGNTDKLPVAVVNLDEGAEYDGKEVNFGEDVTDALKSNNQLKWEFTDAQTAKRGLETDNKYYAVITIPADFSADLTSAATTTKTQATVTYSANEKRNYVASMILKSAMMSLKDKMKSREASKITERLVAELTGIPDSLEEVNDGVAQLQDGSGQLADGYTALIEGNEAITTNLNTLSDGLNTASEGAGQLNEGAGKIPELISGAEQLADGAQTLSESAPQITNGIAQVSDGLNTLQNGVTSGIVSGKEMLLAQLGPSISEGVTGAIQTTLTQLEPAIESGIAQTVNTLNPAIDQAISQTTGSIDQAIATGVATAADAALGADSQAAQGIATFTDGVSSYIEGTENYISFPANVSEYASGVSDYNAGVNQLIALVQAGDLETAQALAAGLSQGSERIAQSTEAIKNGANQLTGASQQLISGGEALKTSAGQLKAMPDSVKTGLTQNLTAGLQAGIADGLSSQLAPALKSGIADGLSSQLAPQLTNGISDGLLNGLAPLLSQGLTDGISAKINESLDSLDSQVGAGIAQIQAGILGVNGSGMQSDGSSPALLNGASQLAAGAAQLSDGADQLSSGAGQLTAMQDGIGQLADGIEQLDDGAGQLAAGSATLGEGLATAADGNAQVGEGLDQLHDGISDAIVTAKDSLDVTDGLAQHVENAIETEAEPFDHVENYGESFAPYFFNVSLWTGALISMMTIFFDFKRRLRKLGPGSEKPVLRFLAFLGIAVAQGVLCGVVAQAGLGLEVNNPGLFYTGLIAIAATYTFIVEFLMMTFGDIGKMISMIIMVLQLTATGGTFPTELNPPFFQAINPFLPMTYGIQLMKEAVSGSNVGYGVKNMMLLLAFGGAALAGLLVAELIRHIRGKKSQPAKGGVGDFLPGNS